MYKLVCLAFLCFSVSLSLARPGGEHEGGLAHFFGSFIPSLFHKTATICVNNITAQGYLNQSLALINNLQANATTNTILQLESPNFVSYLQNAASRTLLNSNCTAFVIGVQGAKAADEKAERIRDQIASHIEQQFRQIARNVTGSNGQIDVNIEGPGGYHH